VHLAATATRDQHEQQGSERLLDLLTHILPQSIGRSFQCIFPAKLMCIFPAKLMCIFPA
jgi:hypothetical protein